MLDFITSAVKSVSRRTAAVVGGVAIALSTSVASAQPAALDPIVFPIDLASIATAVGVAGATMIGLWATYKIGFRLVRKLITRMGSTV